MDDQALMAAIVADPEDDLPRLAYADWLDENGDDARAEFIRCQIELSRSDWVDDRHAELTARCAELEKRRRSGWDNRPFARRFSFGVFERGFPRQILLRRNLLTCQRDCDTLQRFLGMHPIREAETVLLGAASPSLQRFPQATELPARGSSPLELLAACSALSRLTKLSVLGHRRPGGGPGDFLPGVEALAASPHAARLASLRLTGCLLGEDAVRVVAESSQLVGLRSLDVRNNVPLCDRPAVFLETSLPDRLEEIDGIDLETAGEWLRQPRCKLRSLGVTLDPRNDHSDATDVGPLLDAPGLSGLRSLSLHYGGPAVWLDRAPSQSETIEARRLLSLLSSPLLSRLEELSLWGVRLSPLDAMALAERGPVRSVVSLAIRRAGLTTPRPLRALLASGSVRRLDLAENYLLNGEAAEVAGWPELARLHELRLAGNDLHHGTFDQIRASPFRRPWLRLFG